MAVKVLALHGFGQNAAVFIEKRAKDVCKKLKSLATFHAIDAPYTLKYDASLRAWFTYHDDVWDGRAETIQSLADTFLKVETFETVGFKESFDLVLDEWNRGGYDGILGFSQGAIPATALCSELLARSSPPRFAILISGYGKPVPLGLSCYPPSKPLPIPSLHIWGSADDHIPPWTSELLAERFESPKIHTHAGAHFMPQKAPDVAVILEFISSFSRSAPVAPVAVKAPNRKQSAKKLEQVAPQEPRPVDKETESLAAATPMEQLNAYFSEHSYVGHPEQATLLDYRMCDALSSQVGVSRFPHLHRWHEHVSYLSARYGMYDCRGDETPSGHPSPSLPAQALQFGSKGLLATQSCSELNLDAASSAEPKQTIAQAQSNSGKTETPATKFLDELGISYKRHPVSKAQVRESEGETITAGFARQCGLSNDHAMLKTMVYDIDKASQEAPVFVILPGHMKIDTKALGVVGGWNRNHIKPTKQERATGFTGYVFGGTTVPGSRTGLRTLVEKSSLELPAVFINGGSTELCLELQPADYRRALERVACAVELVEVGKS